MLYFFKFPLGNDQHHIGNKGKEISILGLRDEGKFSSFIIGVITLFEYCFAQAGNSSKGWRQGGRGS